MFDQCRKGGHDNEPRSNEKNDKGVFRRGTVVQETN